MELCECCLIAVLQMLHSFWWLLSKLFLAVGCCLWAGCGPAEQLWPWPMLGWMVALSLQCCPACLPKEGSSWRVWLKPTCRQGSLWWLGLQIQADGHPLAVAWGPGAIWHCGLVTCASCAVPAPDLVCSEFSTSLVAGQWWLCALRLFLWNLSDLALRDSVWNTAIQQWFSFSLGLEIYGNILRAYQQHCNLYPA